MIKRNSPALTALFITMTPVLSQAANRSAVAAQACAQALVASMATPTSPAPRLVETRVRDLAPGMALQSTNYEMDLTAVSLRTHRALAQATCAVNYRGEVLSIRPKPLASL